MNSFFIQSQTLTSLPSIVLVRPFGSERTNERRRNDPLKNTKSRVVHVALDIFLAFRL